MCIVRPSHRDPLLRGIALWVAGILLGCSFLFADVHAQARQSTDTARNLTVQRAGALPSGKDQRIALVIGNSAYKEGPLANPVNDARAISKALSEFGFAVTTKENSDQKTMVAVIREFGEKLRHGGSGLFYYAGHGMQIKGRNYLIPVGASIEHEDEVAYSAVDAQSILDKMESAGNAANIMILDACRNNPFVRSMRSGQAGLAQMDAPVGTLVAYATSPGAVASDGAGSNGLYTQHLLKAISQPGNKIEDVFKQVRAGVRRDSQGKQVPWESTSLEGDFYFSLPVAAPVVDPAEAAEQALWDAVKNSVSGAEVQVYLSRFPAGRHAPEALKRVDELQAAASVVAAGRTPTEEVPNLVGADSVLDTDQERVFQVGDWWQFQVSDPDAKEMLYKGKRVITRKQLDGSMVLNDGAVKWAPDGSEFYRDFKDGSRYLLENGFRQYPLKWEAGHTEKIQYKRYSESQRKKYDDDVRAEIRVLAPEQIETPVGKFLTWKVKIDSTVSRKAFGSSGSSMLAEVEYCWYSPALRIYAVCEKEIRNPGEAAYRERMEVTNFHFSKLPAVSTTQ